MGAVANRAGLSPGRLPLKGRPPQSQALERCFQNDLQPAKAGDQAGRESPPHWQTWDLIVLAFSSSPASSSIHLANNCWVPMMCSARPVRCIVNTTHMCLCRFVSVCFTKRSGSEYGEGSEEIIIPKKLFKLASIPLTSTSPTTTTSPLQKPAFLDDIQ